MMVLRATKGTGRGETKSNIQKDCLSLSNVWLFAAPWPIAHKAPLMEQEYSVFQSKNALEKEYYFQARIMKWAAIFDSRRSKWKVIYGSWEGNNATSRCAVFLEAQKIGQLKYERLRTGEGWQASPDPCKALRQVRPWLQWGSTARQVKWHVQGPLASVFGFFLLAYGIFFFAYIYISNQGLPHWRQILYYLSHQEIYIYVYIYTYIYTHIYISLILNIWFNITCLLHNSTPSASKRVYQISQNQLNQNIQGRISDFNTIQYLSTTLS